MPWIAGILGLGLTSLILWAIAVGDFGAAGAFFFQDPWGIVALADLYIGFFLASLVIFLVEPRKWVALVWIIPIYPLGNVVTAFWFALRGYALLVRKLNQTA